MHIIALKLFLTSKKILAVQKKLYVLVWNAVTVLCGQLDCDDGHL